MTATAMAKSYLARAIRWWRKRPVADVRPERPMPRWVWGAPAAVGTIVVGVIAANQVRAGLTPDLRTLKHGQTASDNTAEGVDGWAADNRTPMNAMSRSRRRALRRADRRRRRRAAVEWIRELPSAMRK